MQLIQPLMKLGNFKSGNIVRKHSIETIWDKINLSTHFYRSVSIRFLIHMPAMDLKKGLNSTASFNKSILSVIDSFGRPQFNQENRNGLQKFENEELLAFDIDAIDLQKSKDVFF